MLLSEPETLDHFRALRTKLEGFIANGLGDLDESVKTWRRAAEATLREHFGESSQHCKDFRRCFNRAGAWPEDAAASKRDAHHTLRRTADLMDQIIQEVEDYWQPKRPHARNRVSTAQDYVELSRLSELESISNAQFDLRKLVAMCRELNTSWHHGGYHSVAILVRAILDHVPPIFGSPSFADVANYYPGGKSFKELMLRLDQTSRKIADRHLHQQIRRREPELTATQVNFASELDALLQEVIAKLT